MAFPPLVSSTPPPLDDTGETDDDEFGDFRTNATDGLSMASDSPKKFECVSIKESITLPQNDIPLLDKNNLSISEDNINNLENGEKSIVNVNLVEEKSPIFSTKEYDTKSFLVRQDQDINIQNTLGSSQDNYSTNNYEPQPKNLVFDVEDNPISKIMTCENICKDNETMNLNDYEDSLKSLTFNESNVENNSMQDYEEFYEPQNNSSITLSQVDDNEVLIFPTFSYDSLFPPRTEENHEKLQNEILNRKELHLEINAMNETYDKEFKISSFNSITANPEQHSNIDNKPNENLTNKTLCKEGDFHLNISKQKNEVAGEDIGVFNSSFDNYEYRENESSLNSAMNCETRFCINDSDESSEFSSMATLDTNENSDNYNEETSVTTNCNNIDKFINCIGMNENQDISDSNDDEFGDFAEFSNTCQSIISKELTKLDEKTEENETNITNNQLEFEKLNMIQNSSHDRFSNSHSSINDNHSTPNCNTAITFNKTEDSGVSDKISSIIITLFPYISHQLEVELKPLLQQDDKIWCNMKNIEETNALNYQWNNSTSNNLLLNALGIDSRNILFGPKWNPAIPRFAANLGFSPLEPVKASIVPQNLSESTQKQYNCTENKHVPTVQFDWNSSGLVNPLDANSFGATSKSNTCTQEQKDSNITNVSSYACNYNSIEKPLTTSIETGSSSGLEMKRWNKTGVTANIEEQSFVKPSKSRNNARNYKRASNSDSRVHLQSIKSDKIESANVTQDSSENVTLDRYGRLMNISAQSSQILKQLPDISFLSAKNLMLNAEYKRVITELGSSINHKINDNINVT